jgi:hypothetical protein
MHDTWVAEDGSSVVRVTAADNDAKGFPKALLEVCLPKPFPGKSGPCVPRDDNYKSVHVLALAEGTNAYYDSNSRFAIKLLSDGRLDFFQWSNYQKEGALEAGAKTYLRLTPALIEKRNSLIAYFEQNKKAQLAQLQGRWYSPAATNWSADIREISLDKSVSPTRLLMRFCNIDNFKKSKSAMCRDSSDPTQESKSSPLTYWESVRGFCFSFDNNNNCTEYLKVSDEDPQLMSIHTARGAEYPAYRITPSMSF